MKIDIKGKLLEWKRILQVARKPDRDEFLLSSKICTIGIAVIGVLAVVVIVMGIILMTMPFAPPASLISDDDVVLLAGNITETISDINNTLTFLEDTLT